MSHRRSAIGASEVARVHAVAHGDPAAPSTGPMTRARRPRGNRSHDNRAHGAEVALGQAPQEALRLEVLSRHLAVAVEGRRRQVHRPTLGVFDSIEPRTQSRAEAEVAVAHGEHRSSFHHIPRISKSVSTARSRALPARGQTQLNLRLWWAHDGPGRRPHVRRGRARRRNQAAVRYGPLPAAGGARVQRVVQSVVGPLHVLIGRDGPGCNVEHLLPCLDHAERRLRCNVGGPLHFMVREHGQYRTFGVCTGFWCLAVLCRVVTSTERAPPRQRDNAWSHITGL